MADVVHSSITSEDLSQSLTCSVCLLHFSKPKLLSCAHTFCSKCIAILAKKDNEVLCPLCRTVTVVENGDVSNLQTNFSLESVLETLANSQGTCSLCKEVKPSSLLMRCHECRIPICEGCRHIHESMEENRGHTVLKKEAERSFSNETYCSRHKDEPCTYLCIPCKKLICRICKMEHDKEKHQTRRSVSFAIDVYMKMNKVKERVRVGVNNYQKNMDLYSSLQGESDVSIDGVLSKIERDHILIQSRLEDRKRRLIGKCHKLKESVHQVVEEETQRARDGKLVLEHAGTIIHSMSMKMPMELKKYDEDCDKVNEKLNAISVDHDTILSKYDEMKRIVGNLDYELGNVNHVESCLGDIKLITWSIFETPLRKKMSCMDIIPGDGGVGVGYWEGGVELFNSDGSREVLAENVCVMAIAFSNTGGFVLRDMNNVILFYTAKRKKERRELKGEVFERGGYGDLALDSKDNIYVSYRNIRKVHVYHMHKGCEPFIKIECHNVQPQQISVFSPDRIVIMDTNTLSVVGHRTTVENIGGVHLPGFIGYPTVTQDSCVLVAWVKTSENMLSVMKYNKNLQFQSIVLKNKEVDLAGRTWFYLRELNHKKIAFCTEQKLYIFKYSTEPFESMSLDAGREITEF